MKPLNNYKALSFDIYGTLIDWEAGIKAALQPLADRIGPNTDSVLLSKKFHDIENDYVIDHPGAHYSDVLKQSYVKLASHEVEHFDSNEIEKEGENFASSVSQWTPHDDTIEAMNILKKHYKLIALSNVDWVLFKGTLTGPLKDVDFDATYIAEDIASYKPDLNNFEYLKNHLKKDFDIDSKDLIHVAYSVYCDIAPTTKIGIDNIWIARYGGKLAGSSYSEFEEVKKGKDESDKRYFRTLKEFADEVVKEFSD